MQNPKFSTLEDLKLKEFNIKSFTDFIKTSTIDAFINHLKGLKLEVAVPEHLYVVDREHIISCVISKTQEGITEDFLHEISLHNPIAILVISQGMYSSVKATKEEVDEIMQNMEQIKRNPIPLFNKHSKNLKPSISYSGYTKYEKLLRLVDIETLQTVEESEDFDGNASMVSDLDRLRFTEYTPLKT